MTMTMATASVTSTSRIESPTTVVESKAMAYSRPGGKLFDSSASAALALLSTSRALAFESCSTPIPSASRARVFERGAVVLGAHLRVAHILQQHQAVGGVLDDDVVELLGARQPAHHAHRDLKGLLRVRGRLAELTGGNLDVLLRSAH